MNREVLIGPPGTGKTTALLAKVKEALESGVAPERIGFVSFTKKAATEAVTRACNQFQLPRRRFKYFRTLHSLAFEQLGLTRGRVFGNHTLHQFSSWMGLDLTFSRFDDEQQYQQATEDDKALFLINLARIKRANLREETQAAEMDWHLVKTLDYGMRRFKAERSMVDFTDMLEMFVKQGQSPEFDLLCIDEAQDMSRLQWEMAERMMDVSKHTYIAGDDDQAIFGWAGADTTYFAAVAATGPTRVLNQSYRVPESVRSLAGGIIGRCGVRVPKDYRPRPARGSVSHIEDPSDCDISQGQWLILARNAYLLGPHYEWVRECGNKSVAVSTIHRAKGGEADNVILFSDMAKRSYEGVETDDEHRVFYVAVTRARESLYIVEPQSKYYYEV